LKPVIPVGKDIGFLPGTMEEKLLPWIESFRDSLDIIFAQEGKVQKDGVSFDRNYQYLVDNGMIEFLPMTYMRGRSIQRSLIILDESQNTNTHEVKTLLTRVGEGSKVCLLGDVDQIDAPWLNAQNNGLSHLIERGAESELVGHITLIKSLRSPLADWASSNL
jgi:PhoH-like ATPase